MNNAAMNIQVQVLYGYLLSFLLGNKWNCLLDHIVTLYMTYRLKVIFKNVNKNKPTNIPNQCKICMIHL